MNRAGYSVIIEGNIGAGKTSLARELGEALGDKTTLVLLEPADGKNKNPYLEDYYSDQKRYALPMQIWLLYRRYNMHLHAQYHVEDGAGDAVLDRSYFGDVSFAHVQLQLEYMDKRDFDTYLGIYKAMSRHVKYPNVCIRLLVSPEVCLARIQKRITERSGRFCEDGISLDYLQRLDREISRTTEFLRTQGTLVLDVGWDTDRESEVQRAQSVQGLVQRILTHELPDMAATIHQRTI
jgi:deoxyadenosine/deoxycytidine kinase